ncbi:SRPBCC domain-containing protein [Roseibacterium beibuensis]|uniref:SRPBCC family protein n=1 Tax=[Roseibacterium] beibuensis TaxID=1193142 RepID=UPI00217CED34|nr:SRPBCC domain-containing protein [Roseibacterium beibuensis]MCS6627288.1 SRPBCC domain-containing protein [Roseibacterium beibuensis]
MRLVVLIAALAALACGPAAAQTAGRLEDASHVEPNGHRVIQLSIEIPAAPSEVWTALTTSEGWRRLGVAYADVDFRTGGMIETGYAPDAAAGAAGNITNQIVAYAPGRMLAIRNVKAPPGFPHAAEYAQTATVMELEPLGDDRTRLTLTATGFAPGPAFDTLYGFFHAGNGQTLEMLRASFAAD